MFAYTIFRYLQALKILEELEHNYFPNIHKYRFTQTLAKNVLPIRKQIRDDSYSELTDFLEKLQKISGQVGEDAARHVSFKDYCIHNLNVKTAAQNKILEARRNKGSDMGDRQSDGSGIQLDKQGAILRTSPQKSTLSTGSFADDEDQFQVDYAPIHRCCQVFNVLGEREAFERYYRDQRREQVLVVSKTPAKVVRNKI
jgi:hypothetical protein